MISAFADWGDGDGDGAGGGLIVTPGRVEAVAVSASDAVLVLVDEVS